VIASRRVRGGGLERSMIRLGSTNSDAFHDSQQACSGHLPGRNARAFTVVELLVVVAIIIALLSILIVAVNAATRVSQKTHTIALMGSINQGLIRFKEEIGYYPPVLGPSSSPLNDLRKLFEPPAQGSGGYQAAIQQWWSSCALAEYLLGYGHHWQDGYGIVSGTMPAPDGLHDWDKESPALGIRHPGPDGVWGAGTNNFLFRMGGNGNSNVNTAYGRAETSPHPMDQGKVYGPYLQLKDERLLAAIAGYDANNNPILHFPGDPGYNDSLPKVIVDYWGEPIRYFRRPYPAGALGQSYRTVFDSATGESTRVPTLSDIYILRPQTIKPGSEVATLFADAAGNNLSSRELDAAEFALFSCGPDTIVDITRTIDADDGDGDTKKYENADNIVEVGP
jgi:hypothetical protein